MAWPTGQFRSGKNSRITVTGDTLYKAEWGLNYRGDPLDTRNFESSGWDEELIGFRGVEWSLRGLWNAAINDYDDPPGLYPRDDGTDMDCIPSTLQSAILWTLPDWSCRATDMTTTATGLVQMRSNGKSQGEPTVPTGSAT